MLPALIAVCSSSLGAFVLAVTLMAATLGGGWALSQRGREFFDDLSAAMKDAHGMLKVTAINWDYSGSDLSRYLNPTRPNFLTRLATDEAVERAWVLRRAARLGLRVIDADVAEVLDEAVRVKRMAKMDGKEIA